MTSFKKSDESFLTMSLTEGSQHFANAYFFLRHVLQIVSQDQRKADAGNKNGQYSAESDNLFPF